MKDREILRKLEVIQTVETVMDALGVNRQKAIYHIYQLRKKGYVKTRRLSDKRRVYEISFENRLKGTSYYEIINRYSPVKIAAPEIHNIYGKQPSHEETLVFAVKTRRFRTILAALALFRKITDWSALYRLARENHIERMIGALYDTARKIMLTHRMTKRFENCALKEKNKDWDYIISGLQSNDFRDVEQKWGIHIPFNRKDLEDYTS